MQPKRYWAKKVGAQISGHLASSTLKYVLKKFISLDIIIVEKKANLLKSTAG